MSEQKTSQINNLSLELFNAVLAGESGKALFLSKYGIYVPSEASYAHSTIINYAHQKFLSDKALNSTFYSSWSSIFSKSRFELFVDQILHYCSTYGTNFEGEVYLPEQNFNIPEKQKVVIFSISALSKSELSNKALFLLQSGIALNEETVKSVIYLLELLGHDFKAEDKIKNKEAIVLIADKYSVYPDSCEEFLRYVIFKITGKTTLIKSNSVINSIENSKFNASFIFKEYGVMKLATIFNRYKPIFFALRHANENNKKVINEISKLSKSLHTPMVQNPLNHATNKLLTEADSHWLENATIYALFKALFACYSRMNGQDSFVYLIRNGKSFTNSSDKVNTSICKSNCNFIISFMKNKFNGEGKKVFIPENVSYGLPTSEKLFLGNFPYGTKFFSERLIAGIYWKTSDGADDIDLSGISEDAIYGWYSDYHDEHKSVCYSGDKTSAFNGATEYLYVKSNPSFKPILLTANTFRGNKEGVVFNMILGEGHNTNYNYMMNPNNLIFNEKVKTTNRSSICGLLQTEEDGRMSYTVMFFSNGATAVSNECQLIGTARDALIQQWSNPLSLKDVLSMLNYNVVHDFSEEIDFDLSVAKLTKDSFVDLF